MRRWHTLACSSAQQRLPLPSPASPPVLHTLRLLSFNTGHDNYIVHPEDRLIVSSEPSDYDKDAMTLADRAFPLFAGNHDDVSSSLNPARAVSISGCIRSHGATARSLAIVVGNLFRCPTLLVATTTGSPPAPSTTLSSLLARAWVAQRRKLRKQHPSGCPAVSIRSIPNPAGSATPLGRAHVTTTVCSV